MCPALALTPRRPADLAHLDERAPLGHYALLVSETAKLLSGEERFTVDDLYALSDLVATTWTSAENHDWSAGAGTVEWSCTTTADHAVDCVYAPAFFLASGKVDAYPEVGLDLTLGPQANPARLVQSLQIATRMLAAVVNDAEPDVRADRMVWRCAGARSVTTSTGSP
jgi:hypothetical protein